MQEAPGQSPVPDKLSMKRHTWNPSTEEVKAAEVGDQGHSRLHSEFEAIQDYVRQSKPPRLRCYVWFEEEMAAGTP